jgi:hypothetical protein
MPDTGLRHALDWSAGRAAQLDRYREERDADVHAALARLDRDARAA